MPWRHMDEWMYIFALHDLDNIWRWVVSLMPQLLYTHRRSPWYPLHRRLGGPSTSVDDMKTKFFTLPKLELQPLNHLSHSKALYWLCYPSSQQELHSWVIHSKMIKKCIYIFLHNLLYFYFLTRKAIHKNIQQYNFNCNWTLIAKSSNKEAEFILKQYSAKNMRTEKEKGARKNIIWSFVIWSLHKVLLGWHQKG
jgi:hypothetical protein